MKLTRNERGFTLIELMVVLIIMGILAAIAIPTMSKQSDKAKVKRAVSELKSMKTIVDIYLNDPNVNPTGAAPADNTAAKTVLTNSGVTQFTDPWGVAYYYKIDGTSNYFIWSCGANKEVGGSVTDDVYVKADVNPTEGGTMAGGAGM